MKVVSKNEDETVHNPAMAHWRARLFGMWSLKDERGQEAILPTRQCQWVLVALLTDPLGVESRESLARKIWPRVDIKKSQASLRNALAAINRAMGEKVCAGEGDQVCLVTPLESDWHELRQAMHLARTEPDNLAHIDRADVILGLLLLPGCRLEWINDLRTQMGDYAIEIAALRAEHEERHGELQEAIEAAERWRDLAPLSTAATAAAMRTRAAAGEIERAGRDFRQFEQRRRAVPEELVVLWAGIEAGQAERPSLPSIIHDPAGMAEYLASHWALAMNRAGPQEARKVAEAAAEAAPAGSVAQAVLLRTAGGCSLIAGEIEAARGHAERATRVADLIGDPALLATAAANAASFFSEIRDQKAADRMITRARQSAIAAQNPNTMSFVSLIEAKMAWRDGDRQEAKEIMLAATANDVRIGGMVQCNLAVFYNHDENWREGCRWASSALIAAEVVGHPALRASSLAARGLGHAGRGLAVEARADIRQALEIVSRYEMKLMAPSVLDQAGKALDLIGQPELALRALAASELLREEMGNTRCAPEIEQYKTTQAALEERLGHIEITDPMRQCAALAELLF
jgi:DNA-binding SARP family transcriptional activator